MATVHCKACGKSYSYEENGCCPSCGAYNRPPRRETVEADGTVHHLDDRAASTGRMPGGGGKVCFEEKTCYEEQTRGGRVRRAPEKPRRKTGGLSGPAMPMTRAGPPRRTGRIFSTAAAGAGRIPDRHIRRVGAYTRSGDAM